MAQNEGGSNTGMVAIVAIFVIIVILGFVGWRTGMFEGGGRTDVNVEISAPEAPSPAD